MVYNPQDHGAYGLCPSSGILSYYKTQHFKTDFVSVFRGEERDTYSVGSLRKS
jgi:hypothetical protein